MKKKMFTAMPEYAILRRYEDQIEADISTNMKENSVSMKKEPIVPQQGLGPTTMSKHPKNRQN